MGLVDPDLLEPGTANALSACVRHHQPLFHSMIDSCNQPTSGVDSTLTRSPTRARVSTNIETEKQKARVF